jgi:hypothetical protein
MSPTASKTKSKPILIKCGNHFINPSDIREIRLIKKGTKDLYVVKFLSDPNPDYACWVKGDDIEALLDHFEIIVSDERE